MFWSFIKNLMRRLLPNLLLSIAFLTHFNLDFINFLIKTVRKYSLQDFEVVLSASA